MTGRARREHGQDGPVPEGARSDAPGPAAANEFSGVVRGPVIQARDVNGPVTFRLPAEVPSAVNGLRAPTAEFVGRSETLAELLGLIDPKASGARVARVSAVAGLGGVGKTELAVQAAHAALARGWFAGGVLAIDLHGYEPERRLEAGTALARLLRRLQVPEEVIPAEAEERGELYRAVLHAYAATGRPVLVVVDNVSPATPPDALLPGVGPVIVTSRHTLERLGGRLLDLDVLPSKRAMELLARLLELKLGAPDPRLISQAEDAERLIGWCAGLPLAVQIVAALLAARPRKPLAQTVARLEAGHSPAGEVNAVFALSYGALDEAQQRVFRLMALNPGPQVSTEAVAALTGLDEEQAEETLEALASAHLVQEAERYGWWRMHDLVTAYATTLVTGDDDAGQALERLLRHYADTVDATVAHVSVRATAPAGGRFATRADALEWLDAEFPNLAAAARTAAAPHPETAITLALDLAHYLSRRRRFSDWLALSALARDTARRTGAHHRESRALNNLGIALRQLRRFEEAITAHREAVRLERESGDRNGEGAALNNLATALLHVRRSDEAVTVQRQATGIYREIGDRQREGRALNNLGVALRRARRLEEAITAHEQAAAICREIGDRHGEAQTLNGRGLALAETRRFEEAVTAHRQAAVFFREVDDRHGEGQAVGNLGLALAETPRLEEAVAAHREAAAIFHEVGDRHSEGLALIGLGRTLRRTGQDQQAAAAFTEAATALQEVGDELAHREAVEALQTVVDE
ncbi:tetratricopeptide repeat protein [Actinomadura hibisca]|uniref:tetratricopeptide repeat protein n=1 Tax=Actinomadura hibisca TaxID=68565 RepID=UPI00082D8D55|nr:tetratricopeptide repeat protein [Actinomadura hibisca]